MFDFLKQITQPVGVREIEALESQETAHTLLIGPPACAKSLLMLEIEKHMSSKVYFTEGAATTKAGIQKFIAEKPRKEIIIIDEIDKMSIKDQEGLLTMMERAKDKVASTTKETVGHASSSPYSF